MAALNETNNSFDLCFGFGLGSTGWRRRSTGFKTDSRLKSQMPLARRGPEPGAAAVSCCSGIPAPGALGCSWFAALRQPWIPGQGPAPRSARCGCARRALGGSRSRRRVHHVAALGGGCAPDWPDRKRDTDGSSGAVKGMEIKFFNYK